MPDLAYASILEVATELCLRAEPLVVAGRGGSREATFKADESVVTATDHAVQRMILDELAVRFPEHAVAAEESQVDPGAHADRRVARFCWAVDPLDGTRNFVAGLPCYSTSIALLEDGRPVVAAIYDHNIRWLFSASRGGGATLNGRPIRVPAPVDAGDRLVALSSSKSRFTVAVARAWSAERGLVLRNLGSTALHLALVASGGLDAALCTKCKIWDIAAGALLVTEAGGVVTTPDGDDPFPFRPDQPLGGDLPVLAAGARVHAGLLASIRGLA
jgi:myo-inositol-1(or 4)-monophosphatase